jgi:HK97 family phage prohead protease
VTVYPDEVRRYGAQIREMQAVGRPYRYLEGRAVPFNDYQPVSGFYLEAHHPGSFKRSVNGGDGAKAPLLLFHDNQRFSIGHAERWEHQDDGLHGVWRLNETEDAQTAAALARNEDLTGLSIGFIPDGSKDQWDYVGDWAPELGPDHMDRVMRMANRLLEVSLTPTPAFASAQVSDVYVDTHTEEMLSTHRARERGREPSKKDAWRRELDQIRSRWQ